MKFKIRKNGSERALKRFAFFPIKTHDYVCWLEWVYLHQTYYRDSGWKTYWVETQESYKENGWK